MSADSLDLHAAAQRGDLETVQRLLTGELDVNAFDDIHNTALHYAAEGEHIDVVRFLLKRGADPNARHDPTVGNTPLRAIASSCSLAMARVLIEAGADPSVPGWMQLTAVHKAAGRRRGEGPEVYRLFVAAAQRPRPNR